jgi:hypothetical protein
MHIRREALDVAGILGSPVAMDASKLGEPPGNLIVGETKPSRARCAGTVAGGRRMVGKQQSGVRDRPCRRERNRPEFVRMTKSVVRHHKCCAFGPSLKMQTECGGEWRAIVPTDTTGKPVRLSVIEVDCVHNGVIDEAPSHPTCCVTLPLDLF